MIIFSLGLVRGLIGQISGTAIGTAVVMLIRSILGLPVDWEIAIVFGVLVGAVGFLIGVGALSDWFQVMRGKEPVLHHGPPEGKPAWTRYFGVDYSHKIIGIQYGVTSLIVMFSAGLFALIFRTELIQPGMQFVTLDQFNTLISLHGIVMIAAILLGVGAMGNYLVPLMIGADDMAFPRLNAFAFWINVPGVILVLSAIPTGGWDTGWTGYPPLSVLAPLGLDMFMLGVYLIGLSSILGALNLLMTTATMRAPGMGWFRMPIFVWAMLSTSIISLTATQLIGLSFLMVVFERIMGFGFFNPFLSEHALEVGSSPGNAILFQHLFWFYSHPAVYVFILPGLGIISELLPVFSRKPLFGYKWIALSSLAIALVGFLVWAHHMFTSGMEPFLRIPFSFATLLVAVPTGIKFFSWVGTLWGGKLSFRTPMLFVLGAISIFLIGGLTGPPNGTVTTDLFLHDTYWIVGHFHATMFGGFMFPFVAAFYYWYPKVTGRMYNETWGKIHFWLMLPAFWMQSLGQMRIGLLGMRRRIGDYDPALGIEMGQIIITIAGFVIGLSMLIMVANLVRSARKGEVAEANPWRSRSPEFQIPSPVPEHSYATPIIVTGGPYEYGRSDNIYISMSPGASAAD